ncbi:MAG: phenylalanine--tRNA ligase subunit beta [Phormidium sp. BM_Day4_Bin.17]|nr:phenylalanine--tRNA ligase subunit beta [Phormidium sp. BM_Day4_Bin.17]UCJ13228.1 MAG: phenylalanine--tRNA ligase subunit beta [Phormidium sp. PBR-2020]
MRISLNWLQTLIKIDLTADDLAHRLTMAGFEVEEIEERSTWADGVVIGKIVSIEPHPNADKLRVCQVDIGSGELQQIVCGAPNAKADIYVPVATIGTKLPQVDLKIKPTKLRGVPSNGMICSLEEVGLTSEIDGIHIFAEGDGGEFQDKIGADARPFLGLDDSILDLTATANRADALSMVGVAREVAALTGDKLELPQVEVSDIASQASLTVDVAETNACPAYIGTMIEGVTIAPSPDWLQQRLQAAGVRPINNVVDITNYVMLEWGQPLHAFDRDRLQQLTGQDSLTIGVRYANDEETLTTLDGQERTLQETNLLITANNHPVALAGVMGGGESEVHAGTTNLVLEAALFDPVAVRRSSRAQNLRSESSSRYERGVNFAELETACQRAIALIRELAGGTPVAQAKADSRPDLSQTLTLRVARVRHVLGPVHLGDEVGDLPEADMKQILERLNFIVAPTKETGVWTVQVPPYRRRDIEREIDLIEEIARLYGYDNFCETLPKQGTLGQLSPEFALTGQLREALRGAGLTELIHYSLVKPSQEQQICLGNPLFAEYSALRTELLPGMIDAFEYNLKQGNGALNGFEIGRVFWKEGETYQEKNLVAGILGGDRTQGRWVRSGKEQPMSWFEAKGVLQGVFDRLGLTVYYQADAGDRRLHPGRTASLWLRGRQLGHFGQLHPQLRQERELPDEVYVFELELSLLLEALPSSQVPKFEPFSTFPASDRDLAFFAPLDAEVLELEKAMSRAGGKLLESVELFDEYRGESVPEGQRSLAFRLVYRAGDRTLKDKDVDTAHQKVRDAIVKKFKVELRS